MTSVKKNHYRIILMNKKVKYFVKSVLIINNFFLSQNMNNLLAETKFELCAIFELHPLDTYNTQKSYSFHNHTYVGSSKIYLEKINIFLTYS